jgi:hypothetical protein
MNEEDESEPTSVNEIEIPLIYSRFKPWEID